MACWPLESNSTPAARVGVTAGAGDQAAVGLHPPDLPVARAHPELHIKLGPGLGGAQHRPAHAHHVLGIQEGDDRVRRRDEAPAVPEQACGAQHRT